MRALGDKIASTIVAQTAGVPTIEWSGSGLELDYTDEDIRAGKRLEVPDHLFKQACVQDVEDGLRIVKNIGELESF